VKWYTIPLTMFIASSTSNNALNAQTSADKATKEDFGAISERNLTRALPLDPISASNLTLFSTFRETFKEIPIRVKVWEGKDTLGNPYGQDCCGSKGG
jgi:hypothetical protein